MEPYFKLFEDFMKSYSSGITTGEQVGEIVARLAGFYPIYNEQMVKAERAFAILSRDEVLKTDELTGKAISSAKADTISNASTEAGIYKLARMHVENLEMLIQSAKSLQRGLLQEMAQSNL